MVRLSSAYNERPRTLIRDGRRVGSCVLGFRVAGVGGRDEEEVSGCEGGTWDFLLQDCWIGMRSLVEEFVLI